MLCFNTIQTMIWLLFCIYIEGLFQVKHLDIMVVEVVVVAIAILIFNNDIVVAALVDVAVILKHQSVHFGIVPDLYFWKKMKKRKHLVEIEWYY